MSVSKMTDASTSTVDFDVLEYCRKLRTSKQPPYTCPIVECSKTYKSMCGLQYHLVNFDHKTKKDEPETPIKPPPTPVSCRKPKKKKRRMSTTTPAKQEKQPPAREPMSYEDSQKYVEFEIDDKIIRVRIDEVLPVISRQQYELLYPESKNKRKNLPKPPDLSKLPVPRWSIIEDYNIPDAPPRPAGYIRFIEKSPEDLEAEVEYDMDEEDTAWLELMNDRRAEAGVAPVTMDAFELLMDRLEKESYFQMQTSKTGDVAADIDEDAVCCICTDGECQNTNVILFCDMCNLAVHQDCYGVPYIPEGQWLCRRCLQSPSRAVDCVLCPNNGGAFKQTDRGHWAHVVCALWIPEVRFANTVFLEPIDSIETIPPARWKLTCYLCKQRGVGACIQCHKSNCYSAFHVTCAQIHGLYMKIDAVDNSKPGPDGSQVLVQKIAYCGNHTPADAENRPKLQSPQKKQLTKTSTAPVISLPTIPPEKIQEIATHVTMPKKNQFIQRLIAYWILKRSMRNGVPLLRRLQVSHYGRRDSILSTGKEVDIAELKNQLKYWQCLRQDLERARLLCELVRKREKLKRELIKMKAQCLEMELCPLVSFMRRLWELIRAKDTGEIFIEPVDQTEVPDYSEIVKNPMDLSTMRSKIDTFQYDTLKEFEDDFNLMINNCLAYNSKETVFYKAAIKMRDQGQLLIKLAYTDLETLGIADGSLYNAYPEPEVIEIDDSDDESEESSDETSKVERNLTAFDEELLKLNKEQSIMPRKEISRRLNNLMDLAQSIKDATARTKRVKLINTLKTKINREKNKCPDPKIKESITIESSDEENTEKHDVSKKVERKNEPEKKVGGFAGESSKVESFTRKDKSRKASNLESRPSTSTGDPGPSTSKQYLGHSTSKPYPRPSTSKQYLGPSTSKQYPRPSTSKQDPRPSTSKQYSGPSTSKQYSGPSTSKQYSGPSTSKPYSEPSTSKRYLGPSTSKQYSGPSTSKKYSEPSTSKRYLGSSTSKRYLGPSTSKRYLGPSTSKQSHVPSTSKQSHVPSTSKQSPGPSTSKQSPGPSTSNPDPGPSTSKQSPGPSSHNPVPEPSRYSPVPGPSRSNPVPGSPRSNTVPGPSRFSPVPGPSGYTPEPGPLGYNPEPGPLGYNPVPGPSGYDPEPGPSEFDPVPEPSRSDLEPGPSISYQEPGPSRSYQEPGPSRSSRRSVASVKFTDKATTSSGSGGSISRKRGRPSKKQSITAESTEPGSNAMDVTSEAPKPNSQDIFTAYRIGEKAVKSDESHSEEEYCCSDCSASESGSSDSSCGETSESEEGKSYTENTSMDALDQLQLVWAKCRGYPWYPALIINPKMPRGYVHNGVPIPSPPADVIALANNYTEPVYLVLFFDTKRTWQWLPRNKLEPLGVTWELDQIKLTESRKPTDRKAVKKAYQEAMAHRTQIDQSPESLRKP